MSDPNNPCLFCNIHSKGIELENELAYASYDSYPVSKYHILIIPKRHVNNYFELNSAEILACDALLKEIKNRLEKKDNTIDGFNVGSNSGKTAGQSINHCHIHLIPRRSGDVENPQGGVRSVIASKQHYIRKNK